MTPAPTHPTRTVLADERFEAMSRAHLPPLDLARVPQPAGLAGEAS